METRARFFAPSPCTRSKKELMMPHVPSLTCPRSHGDFISNCRTKAQTWEHLENKGSEEGFFSRQT
jgi:hypothetical protein